MLLHAMGHLESLQQHNKSHDRMHIRHLIVPDARSQLNWNDISVSAGLRLQLTKETHR